MQAQPADERAGLAPAIAAAAWPVAVLLVVHRLFILARAGSVTDDFTTVWSAARQVDIGDEPHWRQEERRSRVV